MNIPREDYGAGDHDRTSASALQQKLFGEFPYPPLNLPLTKTPELINMIESVLVQQKSPSLTPPVTPKLSDKPKALNFPILKITIGEWIRVEKHTEDLKAKFYFAKKKLMWEILNEVETDTLKRKIEILWDDVLSLKTSLLPDDTEVLEIELSKRPTFFKETNPQPGKHTQWKQMDHDFTTNFSASMNRRHTLYFAPGVLQKNLDKLKSSDSFWSKLFKVPFPTSQNLYFDFGYGNNNKNSNPAHYSYGETLSFDQSQGFGHRGVEEEYNNMATQFGPYDGTFVQANIQNNPATPLFGIQAIPPSSQKINEHYHTGSDLTGSEFNDPLIPDLSQMPWESLDQLLETDANSTMLQNMNQLSGYPPIGTYVRDIVHQEEERQNMDHAHLNGNFQITGNQQIDNFQLNGNQQ